MGSCNVEPGEPLVSVIVPVYNIAEYLPQCLESLEKQSFRNFEVLCVDDASMDSSPEIVRTFQNRDSRFRLLTQAHGGVSAARNLGIRQASGKYILFIDGDDWAEPGMLECLVASAESCGADLTVCSACVHCDDEEQAGKRRLASLKKELTVADCLLESPEDPWEALALPGSWPFVWNKLIRKSVLWGNDILFADGLRLGEDGLFLQVLFQYVRRIRFIEPALYHYRYQRKNSATVNLFQEQKTRFSQHTDVFRELCRELHARNLLEANRRDVLRWMQEFLYRDFIHLPASRQPEQSGNILEILRAFGLDEADGVPEGIWKKRMDVLCRTSRAPSGIMRMYRIVSTKIENRIIRFL